MQMPTPVVMFRCDASPAQGHGHVSRCLSIANALRTMRPWRTIFMLGSPHARDRIIQYGHEVILPPTKVMPDNWQVQTLQYINPDILLLDAPKGFPEELAAQRAATGGLTVVLDDIGPLRRHAQAAYYPPAPEVALLDWTGCATEVFSGFGWMPLGTGFSPHPRSALNDIPRLLITMGGADPAKLTLRALELLHTAPLRHTAFSIKVIIGPYFTYTTELQAYLDTLDMVVEHIESPSDMGAIMAASDMAICSFGVSAYELACCGVPASYFCLTPQHDAMAKVFAQHGAALNLGVYHAVDKTAAARAMAHLLSSPKKLKRMSTRAAELVDGQGAQRIAGDMIQRMEAG